MQEIQTNSIEENDFINKMNKKGKSLMLNSWDKHEVAFNARIENTTKRNKWGTGMLQCKDEDVTEIDTGNNRFQLVNMDGVMLVNVYLPSNTGGTEGNEEYEICLKELEEKLEQECGDQEIIIAGDVNYQPHHCQRRLDALTSLMTRFNLTRHVPSVPTYFGHNGDRSTLDQCLTSQGISKVKYKVITNEHLPGNASTHAMVNWTMEVQTTDRPKHIEKGEEDNGSSLFRKFPRVNWELGLDRELYTIKEEAYLRVGVQICSGLPPAWKISVIQDLLSEASDIARIRRTTSAGEEAAIEISAIEKRISETSRELRIRRAGYFNKGNERYWSSRQLLDKYPEKRKKIVEVQKLEKLLSAERKKLSREITKDVDRDEEDENEELILALIEGRSRDFYSGVKNTKVLKNEVPQSIFHNNKWYHNKDVLDVFVLAAEEQSGEARNIPGSKIDKNYVYRKDTVAMQTLLSKTDNTRFKEISADGFNKLIYSVKGNKSQDVFGTQIEHLRYLSSDSKDVVRSIFNDMLKDISSYKHCLLSIAQACMLHKGKGKPKHVMKSYRRVQVCPVPQKLIQSHVTSQAINAVKEHDLDMQWGFTPGVSFLQSSIARESISKLAVEKGDRVYLIAADVESAFSRTDRICQLSELGIQGEFGKLFLFSAMFFTNTNVVMKSDGCFSSVFAEHQGAPQGALGSPRYFKQYEVPLDNRLKAEDVGYKAAGHNWALLLIADDSLTFAKGKDEFKIVSKIYEKYSEDFRVKYGYEKVNLNYYGPKGGEKDCTGLTFGGLPQKITEESLHVGLNVCQDLTKVERSNVAIRVAKARNKLFATLGRVWQNKRQLKLSAARELTRCVIHPILIAGLAALCVNDETLKPVIQMSEKVMRRNFSVRDKACMDPLFQILQVSPVQADLHCQVFSLLHNVWSLDGPVKDLVKYLLTDKSLKLKYWPNHVNDLCKRYVLPSVEEMFALDVPDKKAFKALTSQRVKDYFSDKLKTKIQRSVSLRLIHPDDFDFQRKKQSPVITAARTKREVIAMKITLLHLLGEYKNGENMFRIKVRKSPSCEYCEDDFDSSEHSIMTCKPVADSPAVHKQLKQVLKAISEETMVPEKELWVTLKLDFRLISRIILNPISAGNHKNYRVSFKSKSVYKIVRLCQEYVLQCHNARKLSGQVRNESVKKTFGFKTKKTRKSGPDVHRGERDSATGTKNILSFFHSSLTSQAAQTEEDINSLTVQQGDNKRLAKGGKSFGEENPSQILCILIGGHVRMLLTAKSHDWGKMMVSRHGFIKITKHNAQNKHLLVTSKDDDILGTTHAMYVGDLQCDAVKDLQHFAPIVIGDVPERLYEEELPVLIIFSTHHDRLQMHLLQNTKQHAHIHITRDEPGDFEVTDKPYIPELDWARFEACDTRRMTRPTEDLKGWANANLRPGSFTITTCDVNNTANEETWCSFIRLLELTRPGIITQLTRETGMEIGVKYVEHLSHIDGDAWRLMEEPRVTLEQLVPYGNSAVRYNGQGAKYLPKRWSPSKYTEEEREGGPPAMLKAMCARYADTCNGLKTELTDVHRTAETVIHRNMDLMTENNELRAEVKRIRLVMAHMTDGVARDPNGVHQRVTPARRDTSPYRNVWHENEDGSIDNVAYMDEKRRRNAECEPFLQGTNVRETNSPRTERLEVNAERQLAIIAARSMCEEASFLNSVRESSTPSLQARTRSSSGDSRRSSSSSATGKRTSPTRPAPAPPSTPTSPRNTAPGPSKTITRRIPRTTNNPAPSTSGQQSPRSVKRSSCQGASAAPPTPQVTGISKRKRISGEETMPLPKRMERTPSSPVKIKQEPVDQEDTNVFEALRDVQEDADETIVISDDDYDPLVATYVHAPENHEEDGIVLHPDDGDLAIDELDYEPVERDRGESLLDEVLCKLTNSLLDNRRPFRMNRETNVKWFHEKMNEVRKCNLY